MRARTIDEVKYCQQCGARMERQTFNGRLEDNGVFHRRKFCNRDCMAKHQEKPIKSKGTLLKVATKFKQTECQNCGTTQLLNIHHVNLDESDNSPNNLMTLCASCHTKWHWEHGKVMVRISGQKNPMESPESPPESKPE